MDAQLKWELRARSRKERQDQIQLVRRAITLQRSFREESIRPISEPRWQAMLTYAKREGIE